MQVGLPDGSVVKNLPANAGDSGSIPRLGKSLVEEMATNSSILAWKIPWTEEPGRLSTWRNRVGHNWTTKQQQKRMQVSCYGIFIHWTIDSTKIPDFVLGKNNIWNGNIRKTSFPKSQTVAYHNTQSNSIPVFDVGINTSWYFILWWFITFSVKAHIIFQAPVNLS